MDFKLYIEWGFIPTDDAYYHIMTASKKYLPYLGKPVDDLIQVHVGNFNLSDRSPKMTIAFWASDPDQTPELKDALGMATLTPPDIGHVFINTTADQGNVHETVSHETAHCFDPKNWSRYGMFKKISGQEYTTADMDKYLRHPEEKTANYTTAATNIRSMIDAGVDPETIKAHMRKPIEGIYGKSKRDSRKFGKLAWKELTRDGLPKPPQNTPQQP